MSNNSVSSANPDSGNVKMMTEFSANMVTSPSPKRKFDGAANERKKKAGKLEKGFGKAGSKSIYEGQYLSELEEGIMAMSKEINVSEPEEMGEEILSDEDKEFNRFQHSTFSDNRISGLFGGRNSSGSARPRDGAPPELSDRPSNVFGDTSATAKRGGASNASISHNSTVAQGVSGHAPARTEPETTPRVVVPQGEFEEPQDVDPAPAPLVVAPQGYPDVVIQDRHKQIILKYLNDGIKARALRHNGDDISVDKLMHRSGILVIKTSTMISANWISFMITRYRGEDLDIELMIAEEASFEFAPAFTAWIPDDKATFERLMNKARNLHIDTNTWRFVRTIEEKGKPGVIGKKFSFIAYGNLTRFLDQKRELRFTYDVYQQKAVIKGTGPAAGANIGGNSTGSLAYTQKIEETQDAFDEWIRTQEASRLAQMD